MADMAEKLKRLHCQGLYCETAALRDILDYYGLNLSGIECMGLSGIFGFAYMRQDFHIIDVPYWSISGYVGFALMPLAANLGIELERYENLDTGVSIKGIRYYLEQNIPVMVRVTFNEYYSLLKQKDGRMGNPYSESTLGILSRHIPFNTGVHYILAIGYHEEDNTFEFVENLFRESYRLPQEVLEKAMNSGQRMSALNEWAVLQPFDEVKIGPQHIYRTLGRVLTGMEQQSDYMNEATNGLQSMEEFIESYFQWPRMFDEKTLVEHLAFVFLSGGGLYRNEGFYRRSFGKFLNYAQKITGDDRFGEISGYYIELGTKWYRFLTMISKGFQGTPGDAFSPDVKTILNEIYHDEHKCIGLLKNTIKG